MAAVALSRLALGRLASTNTVIIYVRALAAIDSSNEVFYDNISLKAAPTASVSNLSASDFAIYPNPANDVVTIESNNLDISGVTIYNFLGASVYSNASFNGGQINVSSLNKGVYILKIEATGGILTKKLVIE